MKTFFAIFALAAVAVASPESNADAEADPYLLYSNLGYNYGNTYGFNAYNRPLGYAHHHAYAARPAVHAPYVASPVVKTITPAITPAVHAAPLVAHATQYAQVAPAAVQTVAHHAPLATAAYAAHPLNYNAYTGYNNFYNGYALNAFNTPYAAHHGIYKRDAEAEPEADPAYLYGGAYAYGGAYRSPYNAYGYNAYRHGSYAAPSYYNRFYNNYAYNGYRRFGYGRFY